jgi:hypothetical protein
LGQSAEQSIEKLAKDAFEAACEEVPAKRAEEERQTLAEASRTGNSATYPNALVILAGQRVQDVILAGIDAYLDVFARCEVPAVHGAEIFFETSAQQIAGSAHPWARGQLDLYKTRTRRQVSDPGEYLNRQVQQAKRSALRKGKLRLQEQRIKAKTTPPQLAPAPGPPSLPIPAGHQEGTAKDNTRRSPNVTNLAELMRRRGKDWEISPEFMKAFENIQTVSAKGYERIVRIAGKMETPEEYRSLLAGLLRELGGEIPAGVLKPPRGKAGRPASATTEKIHAEWVKMGKPKITARVCDPIAIQFFPSELKGIAPGSAQHGRYGSGSGRLSNVANDGLQHNWQLVSLHN